MKKIRAAGAVLVAVLWGMLAALAWFLPAKESSEAERRPLEQMPQISVETLLSGNFMEDFDDFALDQFPMRDGFRQIKALFHKYVLRQKDNNQIYLVDGYAAKLEYPLNQSSVDYAVRLFRKVYNQNLRASTGKIYFAAVPDKGYYLAQPNGYPSIDYDGLFAQLQQELPWAQHVDLTDTLDVTDYYFTDTHWRQEKLVDTAAKLCQTMGVTAPKTGDFTVKQLERPFYGVYCGQAALPMDGEPMYILQSRVLQSCKVYNYESGKTGQVYDMSKLGSEDLYDVYLSGPVPLLRIDNPNAATNRELIVFRDSFGSSIVPLLARDYASVTIVDLRYIGSDYLTHFLDFHGQDVLFLYSTLILNNSFAMK